KARVAELAKRSIESRVRRFFRDVTRAFGYSALVQRLQRGLRGAGHANDAWTEDFDGTRTQGWRWRLLPIDRLRRQRPGVLHVRFIGGSTPEVAYSPKWLPGQALAVHV